MTAMVTTVQRQQPHADHSPRQHRREQHPNSDDSISAYIHNTSSPHLAHASSHSRSGEHSSPRPSSTANASSSPAYALSQPHSQPQSAAKSASDQRHASQSRSSSSTSPLTTTLEADARMLQSTAEDDVAAASGMLSLHASRHSSESSWNGSRPSEPREEAGTPSAPWVNTHPVHQDDTRQVPFFVHPDEDDEQSDAISHDVSHGLRLRQGYSHDPALFTSAFSHPLAASTPSMSLHALHHHAGPNQPLHLDSRDYALMPSSQHSNAHSFEASQSDSLAAADASQDDSFDVSNTQTDADDLGQPEKKRRRRTKKEEADVLASVYAETAFPDGVRRQQLADQLGMTTRAVSIWFQNKRQAERKRASRFGTTESQGSVPATGRSSSSMDLDHKLQRWPSLDAFAASQSTSTRQDTPSDDEHDGTFASRSTSQLMTSADTSLTSIASEGPLDVSENKENIPTAGKVLCDDAAHVVTAKSRRPLRDIRALVFGQPETEQSSVLPHVACDTAKMTDDAVQEPGKRQPMGRSVSVNALAASKPRMDDVVIKAAPGPRHFRRISTGTARLMALATSQRGRASLDGKASPPRKRPFAKSLSMSTSLPPALARAIFAQVDEPSKPKRDMTQDDQALLAMMQSSSGESSDGPEAAMRDVNGMLHLHGGDDTEDEEMTLRMAANRRVAKAQAANGPLVCDPADALSDLRARPLMGRSVSGSSIGSKAMAPSLDAAAGRDRSKPNPIAPVPRSQPVSHAPSDDGFKRPVADLETAAVAEAPKKKKSKQNRKSDQTQVTPAKRKAHQDDQLSGTLRTPFAAATPPTAHVASFQQANASPSSGLPSFGTPRDGVLGRRPFGRSISAQNTNSVIESLELDLVNGNSWGVDDSATRLAFSNGPLATPIGPASATRRPSSAFGSLRRNGSAGNLPTWSNDGSAGREMTPRSLAYSLGLTTGNGSYGAQQTPYTGAAGMQTPYQHQSIFASRYLPSSSRDTRENVSSSRGQYNSPLGKGRDAMMIGSTPTLSRRVSSQEATERNSNEISAAAAGSAKGLPARTGGRVPWAKVKSQPLPPPPPVFATPSSRKVQPLQQSGQSQGRPLTASHSQRQRPSAAAMAVAEDKENAFVTRDDSSGSGLMMDAMDTPLRRSGRVSPKKGSATNGGVLANKHAPPPWSADDSGFVDADDDGDVDVDLTAFSSPPRSRSSKVVGAGRPLGNSFSVNSNANGHSTRMGNGESPSKIRKRQQDAAEVLLGLAGEGR